MIRIHYYQNLNYMFLSPANGITLNGNSLYSNKINIHSLLFYFDITICKIKINKNNYTNNNDIIIITN